MDIHARKISFIQEFLKLQNENVIARLESILKTEQKSSFAQELKPFTIEELNERIDKSLEDSKNGKLTEANQLISDIEKWS